MMDKVVMWQAVVYTQDPLSGNAGVNEMLSAQKADGGLNRGTVVAGNKEGAGKGSPAVVTNDHRPKLADAGISKDLSSRAQKLAAVPEAEFEAELAAKRERDQEKAHDALTRKGG